MKILGASLGELLRHGSQFGLGVQAAGRQNAQQQYDINRQNREDEQKALLQQALIEQYKASAQRDRDYGQSLLNKPPEPYDITQVMGLARPDLEGDTVDVRGVAQRIRQQYGNRVPAGLENEAIARILREREQAKTAAEDQRLQREAAVRAAAGGEEPSWQLVPMNDGRMMERNPKTGEIRQAQYAGAPFVDEPAAKAPPKPGVTEMQAYLNYPSLEAATTLISNAVQENPGIANNPMLLAGSGGIRGALARPFMNEDEQVFGSAVDRVLATLIYIKSGKQVTVQEARRLAGGYIPAFADKNASAQVKIAALMDEVENMRPIYESGKEYYDYIKRQREGGGNSPAPVGPQLPGRNPYRN